MTASKDDGGPAFPNNYEADKINEPGLSLRDYFAAKAMQSLLMADGTERQFFHTRAREAYEVAASMLEARK